MKYASLLFVALAACQVVSGEADREFSDLVAPLCAEPVACGACGGDACCEEDCGEECSCSSGCACIYHCPSPPCALHCESSGGCLLMCDGATPGTPQCRMEECDNAQICPDGITIACNAPCPPG